MTGPDPDQTQQSGAPRSGREGQRRGTVYPPRAHRRPSTRPARKVAGSASRAPDVATDDDALVGQRDTRGQSLNIQLRPIGGIFGTSEGPDTEDESSGRVSRVSQALLQRERRDAEMSLLADPAFRLLWTSRLLTQIAQGALLYALLILVVDLSDRSIFSALFVMCANIPSIAFGLPAGIVVDTVSRKFLLVMLNGFRFVFMLFLVGSEPGLAGVFAATLGIWVIHQFYSPSESATLGEIVPAHRYTSAQAMFNLALTISQAIGLVVLAPLLLRIGGPRLVFLMCGALFIIAGALTTLLPKLDSHRAARARQPRRSLRKALGDGWRFVQGDRPTFEAIADDVLVSVGMSALVVIMPVYLERVLGTSKENTVFVFAPAALGLVIGLRFAPRLGRTIGERYSATLALFMFSLCVMALGFVEPAYAFFTDTLLLPLDGLTDLLQISPLIAVAMLLSIPAGFASAIVNVAARSILLQRTPSNVRGQVIATQGLIGNVVGLIPTLIAGIATDIFGVKPIAVALAIVIVIAAMAAHAYGRRTAPVVPVPLT